MRQAKQEQDQLEKTKEEVHRHNTISTSAPSSHKASEMKNRIEHAGFLGDARKVRRSPCTATHVSLPALRAKPILRHCSLRQRLKAQRGRHLACGRVCVRPLAISPHRLLPRVPANTVYPASRVRGQASSMGVAPAVLLLQTRHSLRRLSSRDGIISGRRAGQGPRLPRNLESPKL